MHRTLAKAVFGLFILASMPSDALGFDGSRSGFFMGLGGGYGRVSKLSDGAPGVGGEGVLTDLVLGHGFTDQWLVHYSGRQVWGSRKGVLYTAMFPSLAVTYFTSPKSPSLYLSGSLGVGGAGDLTIEGGRGGVSGVAGFVGLGYEFAHHFGLEGVGGLLNTDNDHVYGTAGAMLKVIVY